MTQVRVRPRVSEMEDIAVSRAHRMAWRTWGEPSGEPWLVLHGGPGSGGNLGLLAPLDRSRQRAFMPDQRGSGQSRPRGSNVAQTVATLVNDLERLRQHLGVQRWSLLAGSWGTVVALAYAQRCPQRVSRLVLRGAFALSWREIAGLLLPSPAMVKTLGLNAADWPARRGAALPVVLRSLIRVLQSGTPTVPGLRVLRTWALMELAHAWVGQRRSSLHAPHDAGLRRLQGRTRRELRRLLAQRQQTGLRRSDATLWQRLRVQAVALRRRAGLRPGALDAAVVALARQGIAVDWVHGRFDAVCRKANSERWAALGRAHGGRVHLELTHAGHLSHEPATARALRARVRQSAP